MIRRDCSLEIKAASDADMSFEGYGAVFGNVDLYGDLILPGAFAASLARSAKSGNWPDMLLQHGGLWGDDLPVGLWLDMAEDDIGLKVKGRLADTARGREAYALLKMQPRPALKGLSIGYRVKEFSRGTQPGEPARTLKAVDLFEVSLVTNPANPEAQVTGVKSAASPRRAEEALLRAGFQPEEARAIAAEGCKSLHRLTSSDAEESAVIAALQANIACLA